MGGVSVGQSGPELMKVPLCSPRDPGKETQYFKHSSEYAGGGARIKIQEQRGVGEVACEGDV